MGKTEENAENIKLWQRQNARYLFFFFFFLQREQKLLPNTTSGKGLSVKNCKDSRRHNIWLKLNGTTLEKNYPGSEKIKVLLGGDEHLQRQTEQFTGLSCHGSKHIVRWLECHIQTKRRLIRNIRDVVRHISLHKEMGIIVVYRLKKISFCNGKSTWPPITWAVDRSHVTLWGPYCWKKKNTNKDKVTAAEVDNWDSGNWILFSFSPICCTKSTWPLIKWLKTIWNRDIR